MEILYRYRIGISVCFGLIPALYTAFTFKADWSALLTLYWYLVGFYFARIVLTGVYEIAGQWYPHRSNEEMREHFRRVKAAQK